jgi:hypothetical protein
MPLHLVSRTLLDQQATDNIVGHVLGPHTLCFVLNAERTEHRALMTGVVDGYMQSTRVKRDRSAAIYIRSTSDTRVATVSLEFLSVMSISTLSSSLSR